MNIIQEQQYPHIRATPEQGALKFLDVYTYALEEDVADYIVWLLEMGFEIVEESGDELQLQFNG